MAYLQGTFAEVDPTGVGEFAACSCGAGSCQSSGLGDFGCGGNCRCANCGNRERFAAFGERYIDDEEEEEETGVKERAEPEDKEPARPSPADAPASPASVARNRRGGRRRRRARRGGLAGGTFFGEPVPAAVAGPLFRFECPIGCNPFAAGQCRATLRATIVDAMALCNAAAARLEANPRSDDTRAIFRFLFAHDPSRPVPWANNRESGAIVAHRLRRVAEALQGRVTHYRCVNTPCPAGRNAFTRPATEPNRIFLCPRFWTQTRFHRAGIVLHEMLHLLYRGFFRHARVPPHPDDPREHRRDNAHCYEALVLRLNGHAPVASDIQRCRQRPA
jgi:hypothetical protein